MPTTGPMKLVTVLMDDDEKKRLAELAAERNISLSYALREGARQLLGDASARREAPPDRLRRDRRGVPT